MWSPEPSVDVPEYVGTALSEMRNHNLTVICSKCTPNPNIPTVISVVKNEIGRLADFFRHYRAGGIECFAFIDNGSTDGTREYLAEQPDVILYSTDRPFVWQRKQGWIMLAIMMLGRSRNSWFIYVDADEHIVFDGMRTGLSFGQLAKRMDELKINRVRGMLVDMYPSGPLLKSSYKGGDRLLDSYPYFDGSGYVEANYKEIISRKGGPRQRAFGHVDKSFRPEMTKYPMFRLHYYDIFANPHHIWPYSGNFDVPCFLGILHYKFLPDITDKIKKILSEGNYWGGSIEYKCYDKVLKDNELMSLMDSSSRIYKGPESLVDAKIITPLTEELVDGVVRF